MRSLLSQVEHNVLTRRLFEPGGSILVAVSGGLDSMVLLSVLQALAPKYGWKLTVAHLDHQLRGRSSDADQRLVRRTAEEIGLPVVVERVAVGRFARAHKLSLEMAARQVRHDFLARTAARLDIRQIAVAHHADDQLELFFLRLLRGSGGEGLSGMRWRSPSPSASDLHLIRPLLDQPKRILRLFAAEHQVPFREDATNASLDIQRNRIRHELLPLLRKQYQPALDRTISRVMDIVGAEAAFVVSAARQWLENCVEQTGRRSPARQSAKSKGQKGVLPRSSRFEDLPVAVQRRCLQLQLLEQGLSADYELVEELRSYAARPISIGPEGWVLRDPVGRVHLQQGRPVPFKPDSLELELKESAGQASFADATIRWRRLAGPAKSIPRKIAGREYLDADRVGSRVILRHWRPGDRFQPLGMSIPVKLQDFFVNAKVLRDERCGLMVGATAQGEIFWVEGLRISERFKLTKQTKHRLQWRWKRV